MICEAVEIYVGPDDAALVVRTRNGLLQRIDVAGKMLGGAIECGEAPCDVVVTPNGDAFVLGRRASAEGGIAVERWRSDASDPHGGVTALPGIVSAAGGSIRACLNGTQRSGALSAEVLALLVFDRSGVLVDVLRLDVANGTATSWPNIATVLAELATDSHADPIVSVAPSADTLALFSEHAGRKELRLFDAAGALQKVVEGVDLVKPYWLANLRALLFVRTGGSIASLLLPNGEPVWLVNGSFTSRIARADVTAPIADNPRVTVEKLNFEGFVQVCELAPFEAGKERQLTNGSIDHFGSAWSHDHRFLAYRQRSLKDTDAPSERVVVVDTRRGYSADVVATRECESSSDRVGPCFSARRNRMWLIRDGQLLAVDLED